MATWKKVIVSGSDAALASLNVDSAVIASTLTGSLQGNVVGNLTGTASMATSASEASHAATLTSRDFSISGGGITAGVEAFDGTGNVVLNASIDAGAVGTTELATDAVTTDKILAGAVTNAKLANKEVTIGSTGVELGNTVTVLAGLDSVSATSFTGSLQGNAATATSASYAAVATSASYAAVATSASYAATATSASYAATATSASYAAMATSASRAVSAADADLAAQATALQNSRDFSAIGEVTAPTVSFNGTGDVVLDLTIENDAVTTDKILDGNVTNAKLANDSIYLAGGNGLTGDGSTALGGSGSLAVGAGDGISVSADAVNLNTGSAHFVSGSRNLLSVVDNAGDGSLTYDAATGVFTYAGVTEGQVRNYFAAADTTTVDMSYDSATGTFSGSVVDSSIGTTQLADSGVTTAKIANGAVTNVKLENDSVTLGATAVELGTTASAITGLSNLASTSITGSLQGNVVGNVTGDLTGNADTATALQTGQAFSATGDVTASPIVFDGTGAVALDIQINAGAVGSAELAADAVTLGKIADNAFTVAITGDATGAASAITADAVSVAVSLAAGSVDTAELVDGAVTTAKIADLNVTTGKLADSAVTTAKIADLNVTTGKIANSAVTNAKLANDRTEVVAGNGLTDGGDAILGGSVTLNIASGNDGIAVNPDDITLDTASSTFVGGVKDKMNLDAVVSGSFSSPNQGILAAGSEGNIDLGLETTDSVGFANIAIAGSGSFDGNVVVQGDLTVNGTASYINTQELLVEDKFVTFASGSTTAVDGGFIVAQAAGNVGQAFAWDASANRWGVQSGVSYDATSVAPEAYASMVVELANIGQAGYQKSGNMYVDGSGDIFIWS